MKVDQLRTPSKIAQDNRKRLVVSHREEAVKNRLKCLISQIGERYWNCSIENFELSSDVAVMSKQSSVLSKLKSYSTEIGDQIKAGIGVAMFGTIGTGKDHLLVSLLISAVHAGFSVQWRDGMALTRDFRSVIDGDQSEASVLGPLISCDVLAISDPIPPTGALTPFSKEKLFAVVDRRYRDTKPTWLTMNVTKRSEADDRLSPQITDRITDYGLTLSFDWPSHRLSRRWEGRKNA